MWDDTKVARIAISCLRGQALKWIERIDHKDADGTNEFFNSLTFPKHLLLSEISKTHWRAKTQFHPNGAGLAVLFSRQIP